MANSAPVFMKAERKPWQRNNDGKRVLKGRALQRAREKLFRAQPLCVECLKHDRATIATIRDHKLALAFGGTDTEDNTQPLCKPCHDTKTARESRMGRGVVKV